MRRALRGLSAAVTSPVFGFGLGFALLVVAAGWCGWLGQPAGRLAAIRPVKLFWIALVHVPGLGALRSFKAGRWGSGLLALACFLVFLHVGLAVRVQMRGTLSLGETEAPSEWQAVDPGALHEPGLPNIRYLGRSRSDKGPLRLGIGQREVELGFGQGMPIGFGVTARISTGGAALRYVLHEGAEVHEGNVKLCGERSIAGYILVGRLPHRLYLCQAPGTQPTGRGLDTPERLWLRVMRGKLVVFDGEIGIGALVTFEGLELKLEEGSTWVEIEVRRRLPPVLPTVAALSLALGLWLRRSERAA